MNDNGKSLKQLSVSYGDEEIFDGMPVRFSVYIESEAGTVRLEMGPPGGPGFIEQMQQYAQQYAAAKKASDKRPTPL
jgi:hypothetical protein